MNKITKFLSHSNFVLFVLFLFLYFFSDRIYTPSIIQSIGRGHILFLHLPIGMLILLFIYQVLPYFNQDHQSSFFDFSSIIAFFALCTAIMGLFLSREGGYDPVLLDRHKWSGAATAVTIYLYSVYSATLSSKLKTIALFICAIILLIGSHWGASLTHGENFVFDPLISKKTATIAFDEKASLYQNAVLPIFSEKCFSCHNAAKSKGGLDLTTIDKVKKGGKHGAAIDFKDLPSSRLIEYITLPNEDKMHMPPAGKPQLTDLEKMIIMQWVKNGADFEKGWSTYSESDTLKIYAHQYLDSHLAKEKIYTFDPADNKTIQSLIDPFCVITPIATGSPALRADFFVRAEYKTNKLVELQKIKNQLVELNLGNMPVKDEEIKNILSFALLEKLILNNSDITNAAIRELVKLPTLKSLSLSGTKVDKLCLVELNQSKSLQDVYIWNTEINQEDVDSLSTIQYHIGYIVDSTERQQLNAPQVKNKSTVLNATDSVVLYHRINDVTIRFTTNDSIPDTLHAPEYTQPLAIQGHTTIKAVATKPGWLASPVTTFSFYRKGIQPVSARILTATNEKYRAEGGASLIDNNKGDINNLIDGNWLGFRENPFEAIIEFEKQTKISTILISINNRVGSYLVMPESIEIFASDTDTEWKQVYKKTLPPMEPKKYPGRNEALPVSFTPLTARYIKIKMQNVSKLPKWHAGKGQKGWLFVDEIFFY